MNTTEPMKVYELAKDLGIDSISLVEKLNAMNIKVKNHMCELASEEVYAAKAALGKKTASAAAGAATKKKAPVRKKKADEEAHSPSSAPATSSSSAPKTSLKRSASASPTQTATAAHSATMEAQAAAAAAHKAASSIIRRRLTTDQGGKETVQSVAVGHTATGEVTNTPITKIDDHHHDSEHQTFDGDSHSGFAARGTPPAHTETESSTESHDAPLHEETASDGQPLSAETTTTEGTQAAGTADPTEVEASPASAANSPTLKAERPPIVLPQRPVAPRRSILKIVEPTAPLKPNIIKTAPVASPITARPTPSKGTPGTADRDGFRIIRMTKENLDQMVEEEAAKKRGGGGKAIAEIRPEDVRFADYRKKEMVFLPKRKKIPMGKELKKTTLTTPKQIKRVVEMGHSIAVSDLAFQMNLKGIDVVRKLMASGIMANMNQSVDFDTATLVAGEFGFEVKDITFKEEDLLAKVEDAPELLKPRPPIVTIMGHVDHGKTSLLDAIRETNVAAGEAGGITQHMGAYSITKDGHPITFIDTPGHEAFTSMRSRGATVTDVVILVVAADDGVMPQTREALSHAKAANVPIIVAMNKIDKPQANPDKIKQQLAELDLLAEDWGGQTMFIPVSAVKKTNLDKLLEGILLQAEVLDLKANPDAPATGTVLEARVEKGKGAVIGVLINRGTLKVGDAIVAGSCAGRVRALHDHLGHAVPSVGPGMAAEILGFEGVPSAGDRLDSPPTEADARTIAENRLEKAKQQSGGQVANRVSLDQLFAKVQAGAIKELPVILKADVFGSVEAIRDSLNKLATEKVKVKVIHAAPGGITESDVLLASAAGAVILGFNVRPETKARQIAESNHIEIMSYSIIYELIEEVKNAMLGLLDKKKVEKFLGRAEVRQTFVVPKIGTIAGCSVIDGKILRGANVRLLRDSRIIFDGKLSSLKRFKDDAKEVAQGFECGIGIENYNDLKSGDLIEAYQIDLITPDMGTAINAS